MTNSASLTRFAASIASAMGFEPPKDSGRPLRSVAQLCRDRLGGPADRVLLYHPDCMGMQLFQKYPDLYLPVQANTELTVPLCAVMPSVTPVCFASLYSGVLPPIHGIQKYEKPVLRVDTLFDAAIRAGKRVALVAVADSSMAEIFRDRELQYDLLPDDRAVEECTLQRISEDRFDLIVSYQQEYDDMIHETTPEDPKAMEAALRHAETFGRLGKAVRQEWRHHRSLLAWAPDHGCHLDWDGHGNHGEFREEDLNILHFFGAFPAIQTEP